MSPLRPPIHIGMYLARALPFIGFVRYWHPERSFNPSFGTISMLISVSAYQVPVNIITSAVSVQMINVSTNGSSDATNPSLAGYSVLAAADMLKNLWLCLHAGNMVTAALNIKYLRIGN